MVEVVFLFDVTVVIFRLDVEFASFDLESMLSYTF